MLPVHSPLHTYLVGFVDVVDTDEGFFVATAYEANGYNTLGAYVHPCRTLATEMAIDAVLEQPSPYVRYD